MKISIFTGKIKLISLLLWPFSIATRRSPVDNTKVLESLTKRVLGPRLYSLIISSYSSFDQGEGIQKVEYKSLRLDEYFRLK